MSNILLIEPNTLLAKTYAQALRQAGHQVAHSTGAQAAIVAADKQTPDVVILELQLPVHNGIEFLQEFRSYSEWQGIPVIVNTVIPPTRLDSGRTALRQDLGVDTVVYKPRTSLSDLLGLVRQYIA